MKIPDGQLKNYAHVKEWLANRMRDIRIARGLTQQQLADQMNCHFTRISDLELNRHEYKASTIFRAASCLGVTMEQVFRGCPGWKDQKPEPILVIEPDQLVEKLVEQGYDRKDAKATVTQLLTEQL